MASAPMNTPQPTVLVVDFGAQYAQLIARRVREAQVYSEIVPHRISASEVRARKPIAIILSGGPASVHVEGAPILDAEIYELGIPILGICYGAQLIAQQLGGVVARGGRGEYGRAQLQRISGATSQLLPDGVPNQINVWMSHFDAVSELPNGFSATASTPDAPMAVIENPSKKSGECNFIQKLRIANTAKMCWSNFCTNWLAHRAIGQCRQLLRIKLLQFVSR